MMSRSTHGFAEAREPGRSPPARVLVDGHAHLRDCFSVGPFLDWAWANVHAGALEGKLVEPWRGALVLADPPDARAFRRLARRVGAAPLGNLGWRIETTNEDASLVARGGSGAELFLVAGRQVVTEDRLEVLAPGTLRPIPDGKGFEETLERVREAGTAPVVPWGLGKWWGERGRPVQRAVEGASPGELVLGDNGGRPRSAPEPLLFRRARRSGIAILAGSDSLAFPSELRRVARYGSLLTLRSFDGRHPARALRRHLASPALDCPPFGRRVSVPEFAWAQVRVRLPAR